MLSTYATFEKRAAPPGAAQTSGPPERAQVDVRWLHYRDSQPGFERIRVDSPSIGLPPERVQENLESMIRECAPGSGDHG